MIKSVSVYTTTIIFWLSIFGTIFCGLHPKIRNYIIPGKKTMSFWQAAALMFTGLYSSSVLYWSFFESVLFKDDPNFIALFPDKVGNPHFLTAMTLYNWGLSLYTILFISLIVCIFVSKYKDIYLAPKYKYFLKGVFIFLAIFSTTRIMASLASYILPLKFILNMFSNINQNWIIVLALLVTVFWSASGGLQHIKKFANICALCVLIYTLIFITKLFMLNDGAIYIANATKEFTMLVFNLDFIKAQFQFNNQFIADWTVLFATIQIVCALPAFYFFYITLQGRTIKEAILIYNVSMILPTFVIFAINSALVQILAQQNDFPLSADNYFDMYAMIFDYVNLGHFAAIILFFSMFTLIVTSVDSIIYACARYLEIPILVDTDSHKHSPKYLAFIIAFLVVLGSFLMYVLSSKSKPALAVRLYELNYYACVAIFLPLLYMTYKVIKSFHEKKSNNTL